jgi:hypothetical protein
MMMTMMNVGWCAGPWRSSTTRCTRTSSRRSRSSWSQVRARGGGKERKHGPGASRVVVVPVARAAVSEEDLRGVRRLKEFQEIVEHRPANVRVVYDEQHKKAVDL